MSTAIAHTPKRTARRAELTSSLKRHVAMLDQANERVRHIESDIFRDTHEWISIALEDGDAADFSQGVARLASTIHRSLTSIKHWYYCGKYMADNRLGSDADARSVRSVMSQRQSLTKADHLKCLDLIRKGSPVEEVRAVVRKSAFNRALTADRKAEKLTRNRQLTKPRVRMEMMALRTLAAKYFQQAVEIHVVLKGTASILERV